MKLYDEKHGFRSTEIFSGLGAAEREELAEQFKTKIVKRGDVLVRQGRTANAFYIVVSGRFVVTVEGRRTPVTEIGPDQPIGEIAFLTGGRRTATVTAMRDSLVMRLGKKDFEQLSQANPQIWRALTTTLAQRLAATTAASPTPPDPRPRTIAVIRAGNDAIPERFVSGFTKLFLNDGRSLVVTSANAADILAGGGGIGTAEATRALNALETRYDFVLLIADHTLTPWTEKAIRHADLLLAVGHHAGDAAPNVLEAFASGYVAPEQRRLVLVHETRTRVSGTKRWLEERNVVMHHHLALDSRRDFERLRRFIEGTATGLVACGGGALCAAHVGVYKALRENGFAFDIMGGTSAGSAMVAAFALNQDARRIAEAIDDIFVRNRAMRRYTLPRYSILDHVNFDRQLARYFAGLDIEDLWLPFFAVSTNLSSYKLHVHRRGDLWRAIRASASIPVLLPPVYTEDGHMLVDGCLLDNVPIRIMHQLKSGPNVVVSFLVPELERFDVDYGSLPSRTDLLKSMINPMRRKTLPQAPSLATVLMRSLMANRHDFKRHMRPGDRLLVPPIAPEIGFLDWYRHRELIDSAHRWTLAELGREDGRDDITAASDPRPA